MIKLPKIFKKVIKEYNSLSLKEAKERLQLRLEDKFIKSNKELYKLYFNLYWITTLQQELKEIKWSDV